MSLGVGLCVGRGRGTVAGHTGLAHRWRIGAGFGIVICLGQLGMIRVGVGLGIGLGMGIGRGIGIGILLNVIGVQAKPKPPLPALLL